MIHRNLPILIALAAIVLGGDRASDAARGAPAARRRRTMPDQLYNYYIQPGASGGTAAQPYVSPRPVPPLVGHTDVTYPPLMPHEFLYPHHRRYVRRNPDGGFTRTTVIWGRGWQPQNWFHGVRSPSRQAPMTSWFALPGKWDLP